MKRFSQYYRHLYAVRWPFLCGVISGLVYAVASGLGLPLMAKTVFPILFKKADAVVGGEEQWYIHWIKGHLGDISSDQLLLVTCLWIPFIFIIRGIAGYVNAYWIQYTGLQVLESIRMEIFEKLQRLPLSFYRSNRSGDLLSRLMNDAEILRQVLAQGSSDLIKQPATLLSAMAGLGYLAYKDKSIFVALIAMVTVPFCVMVIRTTGKRLAAKAKVLQQRNGDLSAVLTETLQSPLEIRAYNLEERQVGQLRVRLREMVKLSMKVVKYRQAISPSIEVVSAGGFAAALYCGVQYGLTLEKFTALGATLFMAYEPIKKLGTIHSLFRQGESAAERMEYILQEPEGLDEPERPLAFGKMERSLKLERVTFAYGTDPVLKELDVEIPVGQVVALIGASGAGKSTFANLIPRFYDPQQGRILVDGKDIRDFAKKDLRAHIAVVPQMPSLFVGTIAENIRIGRLDATDAEVYEAARKANADEFIRELQGGLGYETQVGERGDLLSGGQRQRIAIARAFLRDAPILILDEATSALDMESETMVQQALVELVKGRTTLIIAHRFSTIAVAERILVFDQGRIIADGSHEELNQMSPLYQAMRGGAVIG